MLDYNSLTLAITDLVLGQGFNMRYAYQYTDERCMKHEEAINIALVVLEPKCSLNMHSKHFWSLIKRYTKCCTFEMYNYVKLCKQFLH